MASSQLICRTRIVVRPMAVRPTRMGPWYPKWCYHLRRRGLNSLVSLRVTGSMPEMSGPLKLFVAVPARPGEVREDARAAVLARTDVVDLEGDVRCFLRQTAVFASAESPVANIIGQVCGHAVSGPAVSS
jgi:hypothetical protein